MSNIRIVYEYPHSPAKVWRAQTDPDVIPGQGTPLHVHAKRGRIVVLIEGQLRFFAAVTTPDPDAFGNIGGSVGMEVLGPPLAQSDPV